MQNCLRVFWGVVLISGVGLAGCTEQQVESGAVGPEFTAWVASNGGEASLRVAIAETVIGRDDPVVLFVELRNDTGEQLTVFRPLSDDGLTWNAMEVTGPGGELTCTVPYGVTLFPRSCFVTIAPSEAIQCRGEVPVSAFNGFDKPGNYTITYSYEGVSGYPPADAPPHPPGTEPPATTETPIGRSWSGRVTLPPITFRRK